MDQEGGKRINRRTILKYGGAATSGLFLAGCTESKRQGSPTDGGDGGTDFVYVTAQTPSSIDPMKASDEFEAILTHNVYDPLAYYDQSSPPELIPWVAKDWSVSDDNKTYTLNIRDSITFHSGNELTAEDVVYSFQRMMNMQQGFSYMWADLVSPQNVTAPDDSTVGVTLNNAFSPFQATLPYMFVVDKKEVEANTQSSGDYGEHGDYGTAWLENNAAGSGPYKLENRERKTNIRLAKNENWWGDFADGNTYEQVDLRMIQEASTMVGMMEEGEADMAEQWLPLESYTRLAGNQDINVSTKATFSPMYVFMHNQRAPFDDINVRKAMVHAFDYEQLLNDIMAGDSENLNGPLPSAMWGYNDSISTPTTDLDKAKEFLDESKYSGSNLNFTYTYVTGLTIRENIGLMLQSNLNELGINMKIQKQPWSKIVSRHTNKDQSPQMIATSLSFSYVDPDVFLYPAWHSSQHGSWQSGSWYQNDRVDQLLDEARTKQGREARTPLYEEAQKLINDDAPAIFAMNQAVRWAHNKRVQGFVDNGVTGYIHTYHRFHESA
ncbi:ABC transporter substrate-binding protein [Halegenticoccus tardaugens]|uniref:ABC transporter substrate-binding protein n=1 Tax=Halegenticoccus tardaugens TaxID=2071624 RepID=UPI00100C1F11|nr:ABC transporter substrate-binding protein [Halegenticoccus tardaugens]